MDLEIDYKKKYLKYKLKYLALKEQYEGGGGVGDALKLGAKLANSGVVQNALKSGTQLAKSGFVKKLLKPGLIKNTLKNPLIKGFIKNDSALETILETTFKNAETNDSNSLVELALQTALKSNLIDTNSIQKLKPFLLVVLQKN